MFIHKMLWVINGIIVGTSCLLSPKLFAKGGESLRALPFPDESHSTDALSRSVEALYQKEGKLIALPGGKGFAMVSPFDASGASREKVFAPLAAMQRFTVVKEDAAPPAWKGVDQVVDRTLFFDGHELAWIESDPKTLSEILRRSIPWDMIRPPRDPRGEPTSVETKTLRAQFKTAWQKTPGLKASGIARIPAQWLKINGKTAYFVALRVKKFPLVIMECDAKEPSLCQLSRQCYLEGASGLDSEAVSGVTVSEKRKLVYIGDSKKQIIHVFKFGTCYHMPQVSQLALPDRLKTLANLFIDADDRLWVSTASPDDYLNASIYFWQPDSW